jgi:class 3 adenylate cyclase/alpha-beta hydrolase superfamily lysophospholipase
VPAPATRYAKSDGLDIAYQVVGDSALTVVFVPGFVSNVESAWEFPENARFLSRLASFSRLVLFDKRGTGLSDRVPVDRLPTLEERIDDVRAVLDAVGCERAALFGISEGGPMSVLFAAAHPDRVSHLVLYSSYAKRSDAEPDNGAAFIDLIERRWGTGEVLGARAATGARDPHALERLARLERQSATPSAAAAMIRMAAAIDVTDVLKVVSVPTLVLHRRDDPNLLFAAGQQLASAIPGAQFVPLAGDDHIPWYGDVDALLGEIEQFLTGSRHDPEPERVLATVLFTDIVASTERAAAIGDQRWREVLLQHHADATLEIERFRGTFVKSTGDGALAIFDGPGRAVRCARALRDAATRVGIEIRTGLHTGEIERLGDDVGGIAVHIAARVLAHAGAGEIMVSSSIPALVVGSGLDFDDRGEHQLKGVPGQWRLFAVKD